jgi:hypothetical protein
MERAAREPATRFWAPSVVAAAAAAAGAAGWVTVWVWTTAEIFMLRVVAAPQ